MNKTMMLVTSAWNNQKTFRLIPFSNDAPYNECIFDLDHKVLAIISKDKKESLQMVPKLSAFGDPEVLKIGKRPNGKDFAEERKMIDTYYEYYVENRDEAVELIKLLAVNADTFDYKQYIEAAPAEQPASSMIITQ